MTFQLIRDGEPPAVAFNSIPEKWRRRWAGRSDLSQRPTLVQSATISVRRQNQTAQEQAKDRLSHSTKQLQLERPHCLI
ncbi:MAG: hypothetical protein AAGG01_09025, partial [Planctomycetota bacterium]